MWCVCTTIVSLKFVCLTLPIPQSALPAKMKAFEMISHSRLFQAHLEQLMIVNQFHNVVGRTFTAACIFIIYVMAL